MKTPSMETARRLNQLLGSGNDSFLPKGEVWIGSDFLKRAGLTDTIDNHFRLARELNHDLVCLSVDKEPGYNETLGYRYFSPKEITADYRPLTTFLAAVVDGPFQRLVNKFGLMKILLQWMKDKESIVTNYTAEEETAFELVKHCLDTGVDAIIFADDLSGEQAPLINPIEIDTLCTPFYEKVVPLLKEKDALALLHCCGNLSQLLPMLVKWNLDGLAAIQMDKNDMSLIDKELGCLIFAGLEASLLEKENLLPEDMNALRNRLKHYAIQRRLVLCSSCGLYRPEFWDRVQSIYRVMKL